MEEAERISELNMLIGKYLQHNATPSEVAFIERYYEVFGYKGSVTENMSPEEKLVLENRMLAFMHEKMDSPQPLTGDIQFGENPSYVEPPTIQPVHRVHFMRTAWFRYAAAILIISGIGIYLWTTNKKNTQQPGVAQQTIDISPGKDGAILTLENGKQIILDDNSGAITTENGVKIINSDGLLAYNEKIGSNKIIYHTVTTARGNQYQLKLEDGTRVWLNAASSLRYPVTFTGNTRTVEITGEGYFEVSTNKSKPFIVKSLFDGQDKPGSIEGGFEVLVLGTKFNINAYKEEGNPKASLLEGSIKLIHANQEKLLKPGEQGCFISGGINVISNIDLTGIISWKNGLFLLDDADLSTIMRQISRWYDVDIVYKGKIPDRKFGGGVSKNLPLSGVLKLLEENGIHVKQEGKKIIIMP